MYCTKCGYELKENGQVCPKCSNIIESINTENTKQQETIKPEQKQDLSKNARKDKIYLIVFLVGLAFGLFSKYLNGIGFLVALIAIVTGFIKSPKNKALKILFWLFLVGIIIHIIFAIFFIFT